MLKASDRIHELAASGLTAKDHPQRGAIYGQILSACSSCHDALGRGPGAGASGEAED